MKSAALYFLALCLWAIANIIVVIDWWHPKPPEGSATQTATFLIVDATLLLLTIRRRAK